MGADAAGLARRLRERRLAKRAVDLPATALPADAAAWPADDPDLQQRVEDRLAGEMGLGPGELFLDFPAKPDMLALDLPLVQRDGSVRSEEHTSELQSQSNLVCRLLLEKKKTH